MYTAHNQQVSRTATAIARIVMGLCFVTYGIEKLWAVEATTAYIGARLPFASFVFWLAVFVEGGFGALVVIGYKTCPISLFLAFYCAFVAVVFHTELLAIAFHSQISVRDAKSLATPIGDHFYSNMMIAAGFLCLFANGPGALALENRGGKPGPKTGEIHPATRVGLS
jgi:putative oxidoreductase